MRPRPIWELLQTLLERKRQGSLLGVIDQTKTAMGGRLLQLAMLAPLFDLDSIGSRHDAVEWLVDRQAARQALREVLRGIHDLERVDRTTDDAPRDAARSVFSGASLRELPRLGDILRSGLKPKDRSNSARFAVAAFAWDRSVAEDIAATIGNAICDNPPVQWRDGGFLRRGLPCGTG